MGVPALFRWLSRKYPKIISPVIEEEVKIIDGVGYPPKYEDPNPNGELDNLYLDMNGIVHPCSHPENKPAPETEEEMMLDVFKYTDRVLNMARPRKVLMIAVDGVAPRAKMNQQRARRFRAAQDAKIQNEEKAKMILEMEAKGEVIDDMIKGKKRWDSNAITPGTPFMDILAASLRYWVSYKLASDPGWANLQVIISDATVPGEGEHKIMNFIRSQRSDPEHNPNTTHCIYGLDADLIFLAITSHEPHFKVLREDVFAKDQRSTRFTDQLTMTDIERDAIKKMDEKKPFLWLHSNVLREYLEIELNIPRLPFRFDLERAMDDWVFMCFFVGNDFLPHLPSLDVRDNGIDILVNIWKRILPSLKSYITCDGNINLDAVEKLLEGLAAQENEIFRKRQEREKRFEENDKRRKLDKNSSDNLKNQVLTRVIRPANKISDNLVNAQVYSTSTGENVSRDIKLSHKELVHNRNIISMASIANKSAAGILKENLAKKAINDAETESVAEGESKIDIDADGEEKIPAEPIDAADIEEKNQSNLSAAAALKQKLLANKQIEADSDSLKVNDNVSSSSIGEKRKFDTMDNSNGSTEEESELESDDNNLNGDNVRMWEPGYRTRYYEQKFHVFGEEEIKQKRKDVVKSYIEGVCWVLLYYYQGCPSWDWYYPYHYAPFAADFDDLKSLEVNFQQGQPFLPYEQLMSVLPAASGHNLPAVFRPLMTDPESKIIDFYPEEFPIDMNGKKMSWQGIALLPFIDEKRLLEVVRGKYSELTEAEIERNTLKQDVLFISSNNKSFTKFKSKLYDNIGSETEIIKFGSHLSGLAGCVKKASEFKMNGITPFKLGNNSDSPTEYSDIDNSCILKLTYMMPTKIHSKSMLLTGYIPHFKALTQEDKDAIIYGNGSMNNRNRYNRYRGNNNDSGENLDFKKNVGPHGDSMYTARYGGYKSFITLYQQQLQQAQLPYHQNQTYHRNQTAAYQPHHAPHKPRQQYQAHQTYQPYQQSQQSQQYRNYPQQQQRYSNQYNRRY